MKPRFAGTVSFRLALLYALIFAVSAFALFGLLYWRILQFAEGQINEAITAELLGLSHLHEPEDADVLVRAVRNRAASANPGTYYLLQGSDGSWIAGNIAQLPHTAGRFEHDVTVTEGRPPPPYPRGRFVGVDLEDGRILFAGRNLAQFLDFDQRLRETFFTAMSFAMALAIGGGMLMSLGFLRRVEAINRTTANIVAGKLSERIPITGSFDELDTLAENLNAMLARIQTLMDGLRQVSTDIAHDLRTPLARLRQRLEAARDRLSGENGDVAEYEAALEEIDAILATFSALLRIAQIESGARLQGFRRVNLSAVFATVAEAYAPAAEDKGQKLTSAIEAGIDISGDRELLTQMLANLLENALHHAPEGASIRVTLATHGRLAVGEVSDDGPGIPEAERANVLRRFYRLERSRGAPGNGLGLSLVAAVAELHHVDLSLEDNRPGLRVVMTFPEARHAAEPAPAARADRAQPMGAAPAGTIPRP